MTSEADPASGTTTRRTPPASGGESLAGLRFHGFLADEHGHHRIEASVPDDVYGTRPAGLIVWEPASGAVQYVHTVADLRRRGVASGLWREAGDFARLFGLAIPCHSAHRTRDGAAWAQAVGEQGPPRHELHNSMCFGMMDTASPVRATWANAAARAEEPARGHCPVRSSALSVRTAPRV